MKGNVLKLNTLPDDNSWCDTRGLILYAMFQLLENFMVEEAPTIDWTANPEHAKVWKEIQALLKWWNVRKQMELDEDLDVENLMLNRLIAIRGYLWD